MIFNCKKVPSSVILMKRSERATSTSSNVSTLCLKVYISTTEMWTNSWLMWTKASTLSSHWRPSCQRRKEKGWLWKRCTVMVPCWCFWTDWFLRLPVNELLRATSDTATLEVPTNQIPPPSLNLSKLQGIPITRQLTSNQSQISTPLNTSQGLDWIANLLSPWSIQWKMTTSMRK